MIIYTVCIWQFNGVLTLYYYTHTHTCLDGSKAVLYKSELANLFITIDLLEYLYKSNISQSYEKLTVPL